MLQEFFRKLENSGIGNKGDLDEDILDIPPTKSKSEFVSYDSHNLLKSP